MYGYCDWQLNTKSELDTTEISHMPDYQTPSGEPDNPIALSWQTPILEINLSDLV